MCTFSSVHGQIGLKWCQEDLFPTDPELADVWGDTDSDFENAHFVDSKLQICRFQYFGFSVFHISGFPDSPSVLNAHLTVHCWLRNPWPRLRTPG